MYIDGCGCTLIYVYGVLDLTVKLFLGRLDH